MSAISAEPTHVVAPELEVRPYTRTTVREDTRWNPPVEVPRARTKPKTQTRKATKAAQSVGTLFLLRAVVFLSVGSLSWSASSLFGQVMAESARREGIRAHERALVAIKSETALRRTVDSLTRDESIEAWAQAHGMVALDGFDKVVPNAKKQLVALNP